MIIKEIIVIVLLVTVYNVESANILCLMGVPSPSHHIWNRALMNGVAAKGHNLTIISPDIEINQPPNVHYIHLENVYTHIYNGSEAIDINNLGDGLIISMMEFYDYILMICEPILKSEGIKKLLNYPRDFKFDAIIYDFTCGPCLVPFVHYFGNPPLISVSAFNNPPYTTDLVGGHKQYAYIPHYNMKNDVNMNLYERAKNTFIYMVDHLYLYYVVKPKMENMIIESKIFPKDMPSVKELEQQTSIMLLNTDVSIDFPEPLPPNIIPVGGLQIIDAKPIPKELLDFIEKSEKGAVLFSLGSNVRSDKLDANIQKMFLDAFEKMPQYNFLWKFESSELPRKLPSNVMIRAWMPQNDILAHPKIKAFMSHSGLLSTHEAAWHGVPMIGIPFFADQHRNLYKSMLAGVAKELKHKELTPKDIYDTVFEVLTNPKYAINAKKRSDTFKDQKERPLERAVWWVEWVLRHPTATHLRSPVLKLGSLRANLIDVILITILPIVFLFHLLGKCFKKKSNSTENKKKKTN